jgi:hypothetical protein
MTNTHRFEFGKSYRHIVKLAVLNLSAKWNASVNGQRSFWTSPRGIGQADHARRQYITRMKAIKLVGYYARIGTDVAYVDEQFEQLTGIRLISKDTP